MPQLTPSEAPIAEGSECCANCRYASTQETRSQGYIDRSMVCRFMPPQVVSWQNGYSESRFPAVRPDGWCGQFALKKEAQVPQA